MSEHRGTYVMDENGNPKPEPDLLAWAKWFEKAERQLALDKVGGVRVSTVFLGLDHSFGQDGPPLLYETMVFGGKLDQEQERYSTRDDALAGHSRILARIRAGNWREK